MALEIERKFLVVDDAWRAGCVRAERLIDGLLATSKGRKVRVRIYGDRATLAIKTRRKGRVREEFEYEIPLPDAQRLLANECGDNILVKTRHYVPHSGFTWEIDVYEGVLAGVVIAEIELPTAQTEPPLPRWVGREVSDDPLYRKAFLGARARGRLAREKVSGRESTTATARH
jgi:CYTH domain-containing protein